MRPADRTIRIAATLIVVAGLAASGLAVLAEQLGLVEEGFGWKRFTLLAVGVIALTAGALLLVRPRRLSTLVDWENRGPLDRELRAGGAVIVGAVLGVFGLAILADELGAGGFGSAQLILVVAGGVVTAIGALLLTRPRIASRYLTPQRVWSIVFVAGAVVLVGWVVLAARQVALGGFYSDDWGNLWFWMRDGYLGSVSTHFEILGSKPLLAIILPAPYEVLGAEPAGHHVLAAGLVLASVGTFYFVLRELRFAMRDALPIALLALLFPWASAVRLWPTGSLNNLAVLLLFAGLLLALRGLRVGGRRGLLMHVAAAACYAASILTYEATTVVALMLWPAYVWLHGWRPALPRAIMDVSAAGAATLYSAVNTVRPVVEVGEQLSHGLVILRDGARTLAASLVPVSSPSELRYVLAAAILGAAVAVLATILVKRRGTIRATAGTDPALRWVAIAVVALAFLGLSWAIYVPSGVFNPSLPGLHDRVNVLALYPAAVFVYAILRSVGYLVSHRGRLLAVAGSIAIAAGYAVHDLRQQRDYLAASELQQSVLAAVEEASPPARSLVLTFGHPAEVAPGVPVFNKSWDLRPAARIRTDRPIETYPVFEGAQLTCMGDGMMIDHLPTPYGDDIDVEGWGMPRTYDYPQVVFVDVTDGRRSIIQSREDCVDALREFTPGPWVRSPA